ncbi:Purple (tartrate-resistant) acid phosphatase [Handroanthus impetiginosus]|uniref:Purple acid phosphatase n=1 Tax=Handroanthus impetiginosus TaxID=429701 RepID=A0A2G9HRF1_9LAMI|nr:Purple (tartrate-resistant) acid phosphatase [Handroanthus impetiginosus]
MAYTYKNCIHMLLLLITCLCLNKVIVTGRLVHIQQRTRTNGLVNFLAVGDWGRKGKFNQSLVAHVMGEVGAKLGIDFVISTGDNFYKDGLSGVNDSNFAESFTKVYTARSLQKPWYAVLGNHDYHGNTMAQLSPSLKMHDKRWNCHRSYIVQAGFVHVFFVDTSPFVNKYFVTHPANNFNWAGVLPRDRYLSNILKDLDTALKRSNAIWKIVVGHHPIRSIGKRGDTKELLHQLLPILEANKVPIYINGHDHCLEHINNTRIPIEFLTSGGGSRAWGNITHYERYKENLKFYYDGQGFLSVQFTRSQASIAFYDVFGKTLHSFKLKNHVRND